MFTSDTNSLIANVSEDKMVSVSLKIIVFFVYSR